MPIKAQFGVLGFTIKHQYIIRYFVRLVIW